MTILPNVWCFVCLSWASSSGEWKVVINNVVMLKQTNFKKDSIIGAGNLVIGQMSGSSKMSCAQLNCFIGELTNFNLWDKSMEDNEIQDVHSRCGELTGSFLAWNTLKHWIDGKVTSEPVTICTPLGKFKKNNCKIYKKNGHFKFYINRGKAF